MLQKVSIPLSVAALVMTVACAQTDSGITSAVNMKLAADDTVKASQIDVNTYDHVVTLSGMVETRAAKQQAVTIARQTGGVRDVVDNLKVGREVAATTGDARTLEDAAHNAGATIADAAVTAAVKSRFLADTMVPGSKIDVDTNNGLVTLNGHVASRAQANRAVMLSTDTKGVKGVVNNLSIGP